jgi:hypothetical protein
VGDDEPPACGFAQIDRLDRFREGADLIQLVKERFIAEFLRRLREAPKGTRVYMRVPSPTITPNATGA